MRTASGDTPDRGLASRALIRSLTVAGFGIAGWLLLGATSANADAPPANADAPAATAVDGAADTAIDLAAPVTDPATDTATDTTTDTMSPLTPVTDPVANPVIDVVPAVADAPVLQASNLDAAGPAPAGETATPVAGEGVVAVRELVHGTVEGLKKTASYAVEVVGEFARPVLQPVMHTVLAPVVDALSPVLGGLAPAVTGLGGPAAQLLPATAGDRVAAIVPAADPTHFVAPQAAVTPDAGQPASRQPLQTSVGSALPDGVLVATPRTAHHGTDGPGSIPNYEPRAQGVVPGGQGSTTTGGTAGPAHSAAVLHDSDQTVRLAAAVAYARNVDGDPQRAATKPAVSPD